MGAAVVTSAILYYSRNLLIFSECLVRVSIWSKVVQKILLRGIRFPTLLKPRFLHFFQALCNDRLCSFIKQSCIPGINIIMFRTHFRAFTCPQTTITCKQTMAPISFVHPTYPVQFYSKKKP